MKFADIIVDISLEALDRVFQYIIPDILKDKIYIGCQVTVPFGKGNRMINGYVIGLSDETDYDMSKMKSIYALRKEAVSVESQMIELAACMRYDYGCTMAQALKTVMNVKRQIRGGTKKEYILIADKQKTIQEMEKLANQPRFSARAEILKLMLENEDGQRVSEDVIKGKVTSPENALKTLIKHGWIAMQEASNYRIPYSAAAEGKKVELTPEQKQVISDIKEDNHIVHLLYGVTGSGKTEVYMQLIESVLMQGKQAIVLIPEISLTYQNISRFRQRFGQRVSVMNSKMSDGERYDQYVRAKNGDIDIIIGPRSALFTPFPDPALIIIDEEHDNAYKSDVTPKYHAIDVAVRRAAMCGGKVVLGSATPSVSSYDKAIKGYYALHRLTKRVAGNENMAKTEIIDLREELRQHNYSVFSRRLQDAIGDRLRKKEQILLFLNRRGYAGFISCRNCGYVVRCPHCEVSLTLHREKESMMKCHYCGYTMPMPKACPECGSKYIGAFGLGTQKVVEMLQKRFPNARILRADRDAFQKKNSHYETFHSFAKGEADILVGTQMVVKGHDFPNVTLVGVLAADLSMFSGDYMSSERTFQLLTQAAGRAGRGRTEGLAIIQTYQPEHYAITCASNQDYDAFYSHEIMYRKIMHYPPIGQMMVVLFEHEDETTALYGARLLAETMKSQGVQVLPPTDAFRAKEKDRYRKVIYIKCADFVALNKCREKAQKLIQADELLQKINIQFDINPTGLY